MRAGEKLIARERDLDLKDSQVAEQRAGYEAGLVAMSSVFNEINEGTMRINPATDKLEMARPEAVKAMPFSLRESLMKPAVRLVRLIDKTEKRHAWLGEMIGKVKAWLGRDDLTVEARKDGEDIARTWGLSDAPARGRVMLARAAVLAAYGIATGVNFASRADVATSSRSRVPSSALAIRYSSARFASYWQTFRCHFPGSCTTAARPVA